MFERLVESDDDLVGMVAYALYKAEKRDWIIRERERLGREPGAEDYDRYAEHFGGDAVRRFRQDAEGMMLRFVDTYVDGATPGIREKAIKETLELEIARLDRAIRDSTDVKSAVKTNVIASLIIAGIVAIALFGIVFVPNWANSFYQWMRSFNPAAP